MSWHSFIAQPCRYDKGIKRVIAMSDKEMQYRVTSRLIIDFQIIIQAQNNEEAGYFATDIHLDKWSEVGREWEILDVSRDYFLKSVKSIEQIAPVNVSQGE